MCEADDEADDTVKSHAVNTGQVTKVTHNLEWPKSANRYINSQIFIVIFYFNKLKTNKDKKNHVLN